MRERILLAAIGAAQGLVTWILVEGWPEAHVARAVYAGMLTFVVASAAVLHFAWTSSHAPRLVALAAAAGLVYGAIATWVGWETTAGEAVGQGDERVGTWILASVVTLYVLGPFLQIYQRTGRAVFPYEDLFLYSWNNFFVALVGGLFAAALWIVLLLWGELFGLIGVEAFRDLFTEPLFAYVVTGAAIGFGIALGRESEKVVATLRNVTLKIFTGLLPLVCGVALLFLAALPITGLEPLWKTDRASLLLLAWVVVTVLFFNAVYQEGERAEPLPRPLPRLVEAGLIAMSGFLAIAAWGLWLRIDQHGLTPTRMWAALLWIVLAAYALGYAGAVLRRGAPWLPAVQPVNRAVALLVVALGLLAHTPLLDPLRWSAESQYARLAERRVPAADFDYAYLRFQLGRAGTARFEDLTRLEDHPEIEAIRAGVARAREATSYWQLVPSILDASSIEALVNEQAGPPGLVDAIRRAPELAAERCAPGDCMLFSVEIANGAPDEWVLATSIHGWSRLHVFGADEAGRFGYLGVLGTYDRERAAKSIVPDLREKRFESVPAVDRDVLIGGARYRLIPTR